MRLRAFWKKLLSLAPTALLLGHLSGPAANAQSCSGCGWTDGSYEYENYGENGCIYYYTVTDYYYCGTFEYATEAYDGEGCWG